jgi:hypothetical protein
VSEEVTEGELGDDERSYMVRVEDEHSVRDAMDGSGLYWRSMPGFEGAAREHSVGRTGSRMRALGEKGGGNVRMAGGKMERADRSGR